MFKHFLLTRFNLKYDGIPGLEIYGLPENKEEWLDKRFSLFEKYCLPSITNQTCENFIWLVMFDKDTPNYYRHKIKRYETLHKNLKSIYLSRGDTYTIINELNKAIPFYLGNNDKYVITSRIDNDDAFHQDMVLEVQKLFNKQEDVFISFKYGLQYDIVRKVLVRMLYKNNHFISRIEKMSATVQTVLAHDHTLIDKTGTVLYIPNKSKPMWLEIIHGDNLVNTINPSSTPLFNNKKMKPFHIIGTTSFSNLFMVTTKYLRLKARLTIAGFLQLVGLYSMLKKIFNRIS
jgi:hypothetical protein